MGYHEWIKFGRDPVLTKHFWDLSRLEAKQFYKKVMDAIPERMRQLEALIQEARPQLRWRPDFTEPSFAAVIDVLVESVETRPRTRTEILDHERSQPEIFKTVGDTVRDWEATDRTYSIAYDAAIYWALDLQHKEPRFEWKLDTTKSSVQRNQPILETHRPLPPSRVPSIRVGPLDEFATTVLRVADHDPHRMSWIDIYREWGRIILAYQQKVPITPS